MEGSSVAAAPQPPSAEHWFGTDNTGRDILSRIIFGTRNTLMLGLVGVILTTGWRPAAGLYTIESA